MGSRALYIDSGMQIYRPVKYMLDVEYSHAFFAASDGFDVAHQFSSEPDPGLYNDMEYRYDLTKEAFQTTIMMMDTSIVSDDSFKEMRDLFFKYGKLAKHNEQALLNLYF